MIVNLKQINLSDSDNIKLDKINYNFDQLVANGGGPMGSTGPAGAQGATGITGAQGYQGPIGPIGPIGPQGANTTAYWKNIAGSGAVPVDTILPIHNPSISTHPPVISVGFISTDAEYGVGQNPQSGQLPYQWIVNRRTNYLHNLRFTSSDVVGNSFNFRMENDVQNSINKFTMAFQNINDTSLIWHAQNHIFIDNTNGNVLFEISDSNITYYRDVEFDRPVTINGQLKIGNANAAPNKIAVADDNAGTVVFKSIDELGGVVPYGTIVSILPSIFSNNSNFVNSETVTLTNIDDILKISVGKGINDYAGWYLCNGKTWLGATSQLQHTVPDLNSFSYTIQDNQSTINPNSQGYVNVPNPDVHLVGGADINMNAVNPAPGVYAIASTVTTTDTPITTYSGTTFKIKKLPQIIYLGDEDCYWQDMGGNQAPSGSNTYTVDDLNNTASGSPTVQTIYGPAVQGSSYTTYIQVTAPSGYYYNVSFAPGAFTTGQGYTVSNVGMGQGQYPTSFTLTIQVTSHGAPGINRQITWDSIGSVAQIPQFQTTLNRFTAPANTSVLPLNGSQITYNTSGYSGTIIITAEPGYYFGASNAVTFTTSTTPSGSVFTINSSAYSGIANGYSNDNQQITISYTLTGVPFGTSAVYYGLQGSVISLAPKLTQGARKYVGPFMLASGFDSNATSDTVTVINNTGSTKYLYLTINNFTTGSTSGNDTVGAMWNGLSASAPPPSNMVTSSGYVTINNGQSLTDVIEIYAHGDNYYEVYLQWSNTIGGPLTIINY